jgi:hypothetical protein
MPYQMPLRLKSFWTDSDFESALRSDNYDSVTWLTLSLQSFSPSSCYSAFLYGFVWLCPVGAGAAMHSEGNVKFARNFAAGRHATEFEAVLTHFN